MLTDVFPFLLPRNVAPVVPLRLTQLAADLHRLRHGTDLPADALLGAPLIVDWNVILTNQGLRLAGFVAGHPTHGNGPAMTSQLWAADPDGRWIRTLSRFYKLGLPKAPEGCHD